MRRIQDFINAHRLRKRKKKEQQLLKYFVCYALYFKPTSILNRELLFLTNYSKEIVASVAAQLGYEFRIFHPRWNSTIVLKRKSNRFGMLRDCILLSLFLISM